MNFDWSLKPVFVLLAVTFGIDLDRSKKKSTIGLCLTTFLCLFWLLCITIPINCYYIVDATKWIANSVSSKSFVYNINHGIDGILTSILSILIHILILISTNGKWKTLWEKFQLLQEYIDDEGRFYRQLRHHTIGGFIIFIVVNKA